MNNYKKTLLLMSIIVVITIITLFSYAYINPIIEGSSNKFPVIKYQDKELTVSDPIEVNIDDMHEETTFTKTITITNTGDTYVVFDLIWTNVDNTLVNKEILTYSVSYGSVIPEKELPISGKNIPIIENISLARNVSRSFTITFRIKESDKNQNSNLGNHFKGRIYPIIEDYETITTYLEPKNVINNSEYNSLIYKLLHNNVVQTSTPDFSKFPVASDLYASMLDEDDNYELIAGKLKSVDENGLYKTVGEDGYYTYYFRGVVNNYVELKNTNLIGRIIRINEDGTIRVYIPNLFDSPYDINSNMNYTYSTNGLTNSTIKNNIENEIRTLLAPDYSYFDYSMFCNDVDLISTTSEEDLEIVLLYHGTYGLGSYEAVIAKMTSDGVTVPTNTGNNVTYLQNMLKACYGTDILTTIRNMSKGYLRYLEKKPTFSCKTSSNKYYEKIGLPTMDEMMVFGVISYNYRGASAVNMPFYEPTVSMTRFTYNNNKYMFGSAEGWTNYGYPSISYTNGVIVNLKNDVTSSFGDGSVNNPYVID